LLHPVQKASKLDTQTPACQAVDVVEEAETASSTLGQLGYKGEFKAIKMNSWHNAASPLASYAIPNSWLRELGLVELGRTETGYLPQNY